MAVGRRCLLVLLMGLGCQTPPAEPVETPPTVITADALLRATPGWIEQRVGEPLPPGRQFELGNDGTLHLTFGERRVLVFTPRRSIPTADSLLNQFAVGELGLDCVTEETSVTCGSAPGRVVTVRRTAGGWSYLRMEGPRPDPVAVLASDGPLPAASVDYMRAMVVLHDDAVIAGGDSVLFFYARDAVVQTPDGTEMTGDALRRWMQENSLPSTVALSRAAFERSEQTTEVTAVLDSGEQVEITLSRVDSGELEGEWVVSSFVWRDRPTDGLRPAPGARMR